MAIKKTCTYFFHTLINVYYVFLFSTSSSTASYLMFAKTLKLILNYNRFFLNSFIHKGKIEKNWHNNFCCFSVFEIE